MALLILTIGVADRHGIGCGELEFKRRFGVGQIAAGGADGENQSTIGPLTRKSSAFCAMKGAVAKSGAKTDRRRGF